MKVANSWLWVLDIDDVRVIQVVRMISWCMVSQRNRVWALSTHTTEAKGYVAVTSSFTHFSDHRVKCRCLMIAEMRET